MKIIYYIKSIKQYITLYREAIKEYEEMLDRQIDLLKVLNKYTEELKLLKKDANLSPFKITRAK